MLMSDFMKLPASPSIKKPPAIKHTHIKENKGQHSNPTFKMKYLGKEAYTFPTTPSHNSPCMSLKLRAQPLRVGGTRAEEHDEKMDDDYEETEI